MSLNKLNYFIYFMKMFCGRGCFKCSTRLIWEFIILRFRHRLRYFKFVFCAFVIFTYNDIKHVIKLRTNVPISVDIITSFQPLFPSGFFRCLSIRIGFGECFVLQPLINLRVQIVLVNNINNLASPLRNSERKYEFQS